MKNKQYQTLCSMKETPLTHKTIDMLNIKGYQNTSQKKAEVDLLILDKVDLRTTNITMCIEWVNL